MIDYKRSIFLYLFFIEGIALAYLFRFLPITVSLIIFFQIIFVALKRKRLFFYISLLLTGSFLYGLVSFSNHFSENNYSKFMSLEDGKMHFYSKVHVINLPRKTDYGFLYRCEVKAFENIKGVEKYFFSPVLIEPGYIYEGYIKTGLRLPRKNPGEYMKEPIITIYPVGEMLRYKDRGFMAFIERLRWKVYRYLSENFDVDTSSVLSAIVLGHRLAGNDLYDAYSKTGLAHLMSVSGTHFGLFTVTAFFIIRGIAMLLPYRWLIRLTRRLSLKEIELLIILPFMFFYLFLSGMRIPALRAFIMINLFIAGVFLGRRGGWLITLLFACFLILLIEPSSIAEPSMQLSFMAVLSIGFGIELFRKYSERLAGRQVIKMGLNFFVITLSAFLGTLPLTLYYFHGSSSISLLSNIVITPLVCFILLPLSLFGTMVFLLTGIFPFTGFIGSIAEMINSTVLYLSGVPFSFLKIEGFPFLFVPLSYAMAILLIIKRKRLFYLSATVFIILSLITYWINRTGYPVLTFLDVGQGDSSVIETEDKRTIVVDTGNTGRELIQYLSYKGKDSIDAVVLSHAGRDHAGGIWNLLKKIRVSEIWDNGLLQYNPSVETLVLHRRLKAGDVLSFSGGRFEILHPHNGYHASYGDDENNNSLVVRYINDGFSVLFTGDIEGDAEDFIVKLPVSLKTDILKVAHHGSYTSSNEYFLEAVSPLLAVISVGVNNIYGHPHHSALRRLSFTRVQRTDRDGAIRVFKDGDSLRYELYSDAMVKPIRSFNYRGEIENLRRLLIKW